MPVIEIVLHWDDQHGPCYDCGLPAAYELGGSVPQRLCSICAATHAAEGEQIIFLNSEG